MPSVSRSQQRYFGAIKGGSIPRPKGMSDKVVDEFAHTSLKGLPQHLADKAAYRSRPTQPAPPIKRRPYGQ